jgi:hypothetical protein
MPKRKQQNSIVGEEPLHTIMRISNTDEERDADQTDGLGSLDARSRYRSRFCKPLIVVRLRVGYVASTSIVLYRRRN